MTIQTAGFNERGLRQATQRKEELMPTWWRWYHYVLAAAVAFVVGFGEGLGQEFSRAWMR